MKKSSDAKPNRAAALEELVDSILSERPDEAAIKKSMENLGISYTADRTEQMERVLNFMNKKGSRDAHA